jgi:8-oxo-dGTP diphosphatase
LLPGELVPATAGTSVKEVEWRCSTELLDQLAFDRGILLSEALTRLRQKVRQGALPLHLLSEEFTLTDLQRACKAVSETRLDKGAFRRFIKNEPALRPLPGEFLRWPQRPAQLFEAAPDFRF